MSVNECHPVRLGRRAGLAPENGIKVLDRWGAKILDYRAVSGSAMDLVAAFKQTSQTGPILPAKSENRVASRPVGLYCVKFGRLNEVVMLRNSEHIRPEFLSKMDARRRCRLR